MRNPLNQENRNINQDVPQHEVGATSSVGGGWPPTEASFNRIKGFYNRIIQTNAELDEIISQTTEQIQDTTEATRITLRAIVNRDLLVNKNYDGSIIEAAIPLSGTRSELENTVLIYLGHNQEERSTIQSEVERFRENLAITETTQQRNFDEIINRVETNGYELSILEISENIEEREIVIDEMTKLYKRFGWNREEVNELLNSENNIISVARYEGRIVSAGIAEVGSIPLEESCLRVAEITEAATQEEHGRNGLYTAVSSILLREIAERSKRNEINGGEVDLVYGECNGNAIGILNTMRIQGRIFSADISEELGLQNEGMLIQHVPIDGEPRQTEYNDLFPAFIVREQLYNDWIGD